MNEDAPGAVIRHPQGASGGRARPARGCVSEGAPTLAAALPPRGPGANIAATLPWRAAHMPDAAAWSRRSTRRGRLEPHDLRRARGAVQSHRHRARRGGRRRGMRVCLFVKPGPELIAITYALSSSAPCPSSRTLAWAARASWPPSSAWRPRCSSILSRTRCARSSSRPSERLDLRDHRARLLWGARRSDASSPPAARLRDPRDRARGPRRDPLHQRRHRAAEGRPTRTGCSAPRWTHSGLYGFEPGEVDLACFPLFALFDIAFGMTSVFPADVSRPASCDPAKIAARSRSTGRPRASAPPRSGGACSPTAARWGSSSAASSAC